MSALVMMGLLMGLILGVNFPKIVVCQSSTSLCAWLRMRSPKLFTDDLPNPQCNVSQGEILCRVAPNTHAADVKRE